MPNNNKISIIIPIYNVSVSLFKKCFDSILRQTYKNIEVIIVNDGSNRYYYDHYRKIVINNHFTKFVSKSHSGVSSSRNYGIDLASGDYILFVDADDYLEKDCLEKLICCINENIDIVIAKCFLVSELKKEEIVNYYDKNIIIDSDVKKKELLSSILNDNGAKYRFVGVCWGKLYSARFLKENNIYFKDDLFMGEDGLFNYEAYSLSNNIYYLNKPVYNYVNNSSSVCHSFNEGIVDNYNRIFNYYNILFNNKNIIYIDSDYMCFGFWKICYLLDCYYCNKNNNKSYYELKKEFLSLIASNPYKHFINKVNFKKLFYERRFILLSIKLHCFKLINSFINRNK